MTEQAGEGFSRFMVECHERGVCDSCSNSDSCVGQLTCAATGKPLVGRTPAAASTDQRNPKDIAGSAKVPVYMIPPGPLVEIAKVMANGDFKYGAYNFRDKAVTYSAYISADLRHIFAFLDGEDLDPGAAIPHPEKGMPPYPQVHHLAAVAATAIVLLDGILNGTAKDDRPKPGAAGRLLNPPIEKPAK